MTLAATDARAAAPRQGAWDWWLLGVTALLCGFGLLMILSASSVMADARYGDALRFVTRQAMGLTMGLGAAVVALVVPWRWYRRYASWILVGTCVLLALVWTPLGHGANGARRWIDLGLVHIQPSEIAKVGLLLYGAHYLAANARRLDDVVAAVVPLLAVAAVPVLLVLFEPDFGSTVLLCGLVGVQLFLAGLRWRWVVGLGAVGVALLAAVAVMAPYRWRRLTSFTDPFGDMSGDGYQVVQAWIALASGGPTGQGLGVGVSQSGFLPEAHTDFIAAVVGEELGAVGWVALVVAYAIVLWRGTVIASRARSLYGNLLAGGVTALLMAQAAINLGVIVGWVPPKGLVLPFLSYGASAAMTHVLCVGLLLRVGLESPPVGPGGRR